MCLPLEVPSTPHSTLVFTSKTLRLWYHDGIVLHNLSFSIYDVKYPPTQTYDVELQPGQEASFEYTFYPSNQLTPREFIFAFSVFYKTNTYFSNTFFNGTVDVVEPQAWIDSQLLFLVLLAVVGVLVTGMGLCIRVL